MTRNYPFRMNDEKDFLKEKQTFANIMDESCALFGANLIYISSVNNELDNVFGEYLGKLITEGIHMHLLVDQIEEDFWPEQSLLYTKFGIQPNQGAATWHGTIQYFVEHGISPKIHDLIYYGKLNQMFEVSHVSDLHEFRYQLDSVLYDYDHVKIDSGVTNAAIKSLEDIDDKDKLEQGDAIGIEEATKYVDPVIDISDTDGLFGD